MTRRGARVVGETNSASAEWQRAIDRARTGDRPDDRATGAPRTPPPAWEPEVWIEVDTDVSFAEVESPARPATPSKRRRRPALASDVVAELADAGGPRRAAGLQRTLAEAARAYEADRYGDALRLVRPLAEAAPSAPAVRELHGLVLYRLGRWRPARKELEAAHQLSGSFDQYPVIADCQRALGRHDAVAELWEDLRRASPSPEVLAEGRIVAAGSLADRGDAAGAIALLERAGVDRARPKTHHLRTWYALADLYERGGDVPRARELFRRVMAHDPSFHDVGERLAAL